MMHDDIDRMLADEDTITPSAGFVTSVMAAVERETATPPPLEFPWLRALPGLVATTAAMVVAIWHAITSLRNPASLAIFEEQARQLTVVVTSLGLHWVLFAVVITIVSVILPLRLTRASHSS